MQNRLRYVEENTQSAFFLIVWNKSKLNFVLILPIFVQYIIISIAQTLDSVKCKVDTNLK
jgi:hypothetical protein